MGAPKIVQKQLELSLKLSLELSLKLSLELSLKTQLKTRLQTRVTPLIKEQDKFLKGRAHKSNSKGKSKDLIKCVKCYTRTFL